MKAITKNILRKKPPEDLYSLAGVLAAELFESGLGADMLNRYRAGDTLEDLDEILNDAAIMEKLIECEQIPDPHGGDMLTWSLVFAMHVAIPCPICGNFDPQD